MGTRRCRLGEEEERGFWSILVAWFFWSHTSESIFNGVEAFCGFCFRMEVHRSFAFFSILSYACPLDRSRGSSYLISTGWRTRVNIAESYCLRQYQLSHWLYIIFSKEDFDLGVGGHCTGGGMRRACEVWTGERGWGNGETRRERYYAFGQHQTVSYCIVVSNL